MECKNCKKILTGRNKVFCSKRCLCISNGKKTGGWNKNPQKLICQKCNKEYYVSLHQKTKSKYCSRKCQNISINKFKGKLGKECINYKSGIQIYRRIAYSHFPKKCMTCNTTTGWIEVHHKDEDRHNNNIENLLILCRSCHKKEHHIKRDNLGRFTS